MTCPVRTLKLNRATLLSCAASGTCTFRFCMFKFLSEIGSPLVRVFHMVSYLFCTASLVVPVSASGYL